MATAVPASVPFLPPASDNGLYHYRQNGVVGHGDATGADHNITVTSSESHYKGNYARMFYLTFQFHRLVGMLPQEEQVMQTPKCVCWPIACDH